MHSDSTLRGTAWTGMLVMSNAEKNVLYKRYILQKYIYIYLKNAPQKRWPYSNLG